MLGCLTFDPASFIKGTSVQNISEPPVPQLEIGVEDSGSPSPLDLPLPREVLDQVFLLSFQQLHSLARCMLRGQRGAVTLTPTVLVNEAWIKLSESPWVASLSPLHFRRIAGRAMRQVLVDAARRRNSARRGSGVLRITWDDIADPRSPDRSKEVLALDAALNELHRVSERTATLVEAHFFGGLDWDECAQLLNISKATTMRDWRYARAWLAQRIKQ